MIVSPKIHLSFGILLMISFACTNSSVYDEVYTIAEEGWHYSEELEFIIPISDTSISCDVLLHVRNNKNYQFSNLWLFVTTTAPNGSSQRDTLEILLADERGYWLGKGTRSINSLLITYLSDVKFPYRGVYTMEVQQAMRDTVLNDVLDFGVRVESHK